MSSGLVTGSYSPGCGFDAAWALCCCGATSGGFSGAPEMRSCPVMRWKRAVRDYVSHEVRRLLLERDCSRRGAVELAVRVGKNPLGRYCPRRCGSN
ncbi:unnamed protein product [Parnassius apollo]|uniref:(apollo) hypothetical protein n=1 Tax=Parnassius apollo TaxID=110799 RepID=A0A8S3WAF8_PARAO|nr:unnamed protein product [Parnassius apollo]